MAEAFGVEMGHHEGPQVSAYRLASAANGTYVECFDKPPDPVFWELFANRPRIAMGEYEPPAEPGFGIQLDSTFVRRSLVAKRATP